MTSQQFPKSDNLYLIIIGGKNRIGSKSVLSVLLTDSFLLFLGKKGEREAILLQWGKVIQDDEVMPLLTQVQLCNFCMGSYWKDIGVTLQFV